MKPWSRRRSFVLILWSSLVFFGCARASEPAPGGGATKAPAASGPSAKTGAEGEAAPLGGRMVVSEATVTLRTPHPESEADAVSHFAAAGGGYVVSRDMTRSDDVVKNVELTVRVPASKFDATLAELRRHGSVLDESASGHDVTEEFSDTEAELKSKRRLEARLLEIVDGSSSVKDMLEVENELTRIRTDIDKLEGHSRLLANRVAFATIHVTFVSPLQPGVEDGESLASRLANAFREAGAVFSHVTMGIIVALGAALPLVVPASAAWLLVRRRRRIAPVKAVE